MKRVSFACASGSAGAVPLRTAVFTTLFTLFAAAACDRAEPIATYRTRGQVTAKSGQGDDARVNILHEAIPTFKDRDGKVVGMESMEMIFGYAPAVSAGSLAPGDKLAFDFEVRWSGTPPIVLTRVEKLPSDTTLTLTTTHH
jgi:hypothetical protein